MIEASRRLLLGSIALEPNRWTPTKEPWNDIADLLPKVRAAGFGHVEIWEFHISRSTASELARILDVASENGISFPVLAMYPDFLSDSAANKEYFEDIARRAAAFGVEKLKTFTGNRASDSLSPEERIHSLAQLELLAKIASEQGITVSAELHQNSLSDSVDEAMRTLERVDADINICFQPIDFTSTEKTLQDFTRLLPHTDHIHLQGRRSGDFVQLANADIDYEQLFNVANASGYTGDLCIEFVKACLVETPDLFDIDLVLNNASIDRQFVIDQLGLTTMRGV